MKLRDLGLSYEQAAHGVQSAIKYEMEERGWRGNENEWKHLRAGIDMRAAEAAGLVQLLIQKGILTEDEYLEAMRLSANEELARYIEYLRKTYGLPDNVSFG